MFSNENNRRTKELSHSFVQYNYALYYPYPIQGIGKSNLFTPALYNVNITTTINQLLKIYKTRMYKFVHS